MDPLFVSLGFMLLAEALLHAEHSYLLGHLHPWGVTSLRFLSAVAATFSALRLPIYFQKVQHLNRSSSRSLARKARLLAATEASPDAMFIFESVRDANGAICDFCVSFLNVNGEKMLHTSQEELLGKNLGSVFPVLREIGRLQQYAEVVETGEALVLDTESPVLRVDQQPAFCRISVVKLGDGVFVTCTDVTRSHLAQRELKRALAFSSSIVSSSPLGIIITDLVGIIQTVNPSAERLLRQSAASLCGTSIVKLHHPREIKKRADALTLQSGRPVAPNHEVLSTNPLSGVVEDHNWTYILKDGTRLPVHLRMTLVRDEQGQSCALMATVYDLIERKQSDDRIYKLSHFDSLTGLPTRSLLCERLELMLQRANRSQQPFAVLLIDLDNFKRINESLGHSFGDSVLCSIAERLRRSLRRDDIIARFAGDSFIIVLAEITDRSHVEVVARKLLAKLSEPISLCDHEVTVTATIGVSLYPDATDVDELLKRAEIAMHARKSAGKNSFGTFTRELGKYAAESLALESELKSALAGEELFLVYQPQVCLKTNQLTGVEALIRWKSPKRGLVMPLAFIPLAEENGMIIPIGEWALMTACREMAQFNRMVGRDLTLAVNLSPVQVHQSEILNTIESALLESGLDPKCLEIEITERLLVKNSEESFATIEQIQALGVATAIDDFGTGFSNMSYITRYKIDRLKIDRSFVSRCTTDANSLAVTTAIIALAHSLGMQVVAEGVEAPDQAATLADLACDTVQGYLYAKPLSLTDLRHFAEAGEILDQCPEDLTSESLQLDPLDGVAAVAAGPWRQERILHI